MRRIRIPHHLVARLGVAQYLAASLRGRAYVNDGQEMVKARRTTLMLKISTASATGSQLSKSGCRCIVHDLKKQIEQQVDALIRARAILDDGQKVRMA